MPRRDKLPRISHVAGPGLPVDQAAFYASGMSMEGIVGRLQFESVEGVEILGNAVLVSAGVAITAAHVVEPYRAQMEAGEKWLWFFTYVRPNYIYLWRVELISLIVNSDMAILSMSIDHPPRELDVARITSRTPSVGESVVLTGFVANSSFRARNELGQLGTHTCATRGVITAVYPQGRDRVMLPFASFEVQCPAWGGMSGGGIFDADGWLLGIVSSSFSVQDPTDLSGPAYGSMILWSLGVPFRTVWHTGDVDGSNALVDMARSKALIDVPEAVIMRDDGCYYRSWVRDDLRTDAMVRGD